MPPALLGVASKLIGAVVANPVKTLIGTVVGGKLIGGIKNSRLFDGDGNPFTINRPPKRKKGLTYSEIRGAVKVLKLVKRFTAPGRKSLLRSKKC